MLPDKNDKRLFERKMRGYNGFVAQDSVNVFNRPEKPNNASFVENSFELCINDRSTLAQRLKDR